MFDNPTLSKTSHDDCTPYILTAPKKPNVFIIYRFEVLLIFRQLFLVAWQQFGFRVQFTSLYNVFDNVP